MPAKKSLAPGQESHAQDHQHVEQVARMAYARVNPRANHSAQAMLRVQFRQAHQAPPAEGVPRLHFEPACHKKKNAAH